MDTSSALDFQLAHRFFSTDCFNRVWEFIEKPRRTPDEDEQMLLLTLASLWHWTQREDCTDRNLSIGYWQTARVYALLGQSGNAMRYAELCLQISKEQPAFYQGYAHEAVARAAMVAGDMPRMANHLDQARKFAAAVADDEERAMLEKDLQTLA